VSVRELQEHLFVEELGKATPMHASPPLKGRAKSKSIHQLTPIVWLDLEL